MAIDCMLYPRLRSWSDNSVALDSNVSGFELIRLIRRAELYGTFLLQCFGGSLRVEGIDARFQNA